MKCISCNEHDIEVVSFNASYFEALNETKNLFKNEISLSSSAGQHRGMDCDSLKQDYENHNKLVESILNLKNWMVKRGTGTSEQLRRLDELESESRASALDALSTACDMKCDWALAMGCNLNS